MRKTDRTGQDDLQIASISLLLMTDDTCHNNGHNFHNYEMPDSFLRLLGHYFLFVDMESRFPEPVNYSATFKFSLTPHGTFPKSIARAWPSSFQWLEHGAKRDFRDHPKTEGASEESVAFQTNKILIGMKYICIQLTRSTGDCYNLRLSLQARRFGPGTGEVDEGGGVGVLGIWSAADRMKSSSGKASSVARDLE